MILIVISRLLDEQKLDWIAYAAVAVIIASGYHMYSILKKKLNKFKQLPRQRSHYTF